MKNKYIAALLAIFLGLFGVHKFYLGQKNAGIIYLIFFWTGIPEIIGIVEGVIYLFTSEESFNKKYDAHKEHENPAIA